MITSRKAQTKTGRQALDKLVPQEQLSVIMSRVQITMRNCCGSKQRWNKHVVQHKPSRSPQLHPKWDRDGDANMGAMFQEASNRSANAQEPSQLWHFQGECAKLAGGGDWDGVNVVNGAIIVPAKGQGQRKEAPRKEILRQREETEKCWKMRILVPRTCDHCGAYSHRRAQLSSRAKKQLTMRGGMGR